jgi:predicted porin
MSAYLLVFLCFFCSLGELAGKTGTLLRTVEKELQCGMEHRARMENITQTIQQGDNRMKKKMLGLAVFGALTSGAGGTLAQTSNVSIYGLIDIGVVRESGGPATGAVTKLTSGIANGSRLGFRGTEDLGGGLSAIFTLENGFQGDTGALGQGGLLFGRQAFVGLQGGFGKLTLGRQYTPIDNTLGVLDPFGNNFEGKAVNTFARGYVSRFDNGVMYTTPLLGGFQADLSYGFGEVPGDTSAGRYIGTSLHYTVGPLGLKLAYQRSNTRPAAAAGTTPAVLTGSDSNLVIGGTYNFGPVILHAAWGRTEGDRGPATTGDFNDAFIGATVPFGPHKVMANFARRNDKLGTADANSYGLGYMHALSKRTFLHASYGHVDSRGAGSARYTVGSAIEAGTGSNGLAFGLRHLF